MTERDPVELRVDDAAIASVVAHVAGRTEGVAQLRPIGPLFALSPVVGRVSRTVRRHDMSPRAGGRAAVTVTRSGPTTATTGDADATEPAGITVTVRLTLIGSVPVRQTVELVQQRLADELDRLVGVAHHVTVQVVGVDQSQ